MPSGSHPICGQSPCRQNSSRAAIQNRIAITRNSLIRIRSAFVNRELVRTSAGAKTGRSAHDPIGDIVDLEIKAHNLIEFTRIEALRMRMGRGIAAALFISAVITASCSKQEVPGLTAEFQQISMRSTLYAEAPKVVASPKPTFPNEHASAISSQIGISYDVNLAYFETVSLADKSYDIYEVVGVPDTFVGVPQTGRKLLLITL